MQITVFGAGYVGLVTGVCLAEVGNSVVIVDVALEKINKLQQGILPIYEPGLTELLTQNLQAGRLNFTTDLAMAVQHGEYQFIAVGTPSKQDGSADLQYVFQVATAIGKYLNQTAIIISKSTVPVGTTKQIDAIIETELHSRKLKLNYEVVSNPEFLKEGSAIADFMNPDRIVVGVNNQQALEKMRQLYAPLIKQEKQFIAMSVLSSELTKYAANAFLATKISFINEMSQLAECLGADIEEVRQGIGSDSRIGPHFLLAGCGYGGSCFPKDVRALQKTAENHQFKLSLLAAAEQVNARQKQVLYHKINRYFNQQLKGKIIAVWGLAFKPNTDDIREASSQTLLGLLWQAGASVQAYDPVAQQEAQRFYGNHPNLTLCQTAQQALTRADALAIVTEWDEFRKPDFAAIKQLLRHPVIFDGRNLYEPALVVQHGIHYFAIGRPVINP